MVPHNEEEAAQPFCKSFQAGTKCEVPPFFEVMVVCSRFLPLFPQPLPLLSISRRIPRRRHSPDGNLLSWDFPRRISFPFCRSELMWVWCAATQARCPAPSGQGISREGEARQHPDSTSTPWWGLVFLWHWSFFGSPTHRTTFAITKKNKIVSASDHPLLISQPPQQVCVLHRHLSWWLMEGVSLFAGWRNTPGTARFAGFAISVGLTVGNSWSSKVRCAIARYQMNKTKQGCPELPLMSNRSNTKWPQESLPCERQTRVLNSAFSLRSFLASLERTHSKDQGPWLLCSLTPWTFLAPPQFSNNPL